MSPSYIELTECKFCGEEIYNHKRYDHLPCEGVKVAEEQQKANTSVSWGGR